MAAQKLELAQALLRKSVAKGLILRESAPDIKIALGKNEDPCSTLACERARTDGGRHVMSQNSQQTLKASLVKHPVGGPDAKNPLFDDPAPKAPLPPHPPPPHLTPKQTAHQTFEQRFKELSGKGDSSPPTPHPPLGSPPHGRRGGGHRESGEARERARRRLHRMHAASPGHGRAGGGGPHGGERDTGSSEQRVAAAHEHLAAKARHGQGLAAQAHQRHHAFHFPAYMVKNSADQQGVCVLMGAHVCSYVFMCVNVCSCVFMCFHVFSCLLICLHVCSCVLLYTLRLSVQVRAMRGRDNVYGQGGRNGLHAMATRAGVYYVCAWVLQGVLMGPNGEPRMKKIGDVVSSHWLPKA